MSYKRLTKRLSNGKIGCLQEYSQKDLINRLAELEDKIEDGTLIVVDEPFVAFDYISNGKEYYAVKIAEERDLAINLTKAEAEKKLEILKGGAK